MPFGTNIPPALKKKVLAFVGTHKAAAEKYGLAVTTTRRLRVEAGVSTPRRTPWTEASVARLVKLAAKGWDNGKIAADLGMTRDQISAKVKAMKLRAPEPKPQVAPWVARALHAWEKTFSR